ncbi:hypothetical protein [Terasakiella sp.]|uniref:hypothetical protein n=1 Tax=Terasakiella sp. TaxID=2034861 RepID=UPI003AA83B10
MSFLKSCKILFPTAALLFLQACSSSPYVEDWNRERISEVPKNGIEVAICFDKTVHSRQQVLDQARQECKARVTEVQNLVEYKKLGQIKYLDQAEGEVFAGPVERQRKLKAILASIQLGYLENDIWECPIATPNRIKFKCLYDPNATDSAQGSSSMPMPEQDIELPPELPADLKPQ